MAGAMEVVMIDMLGGKKVSVKCNKNDTIGDVKKLVAAIIGTRPKKIRIDKWYTTINAEIHNDRMEIYYKENVVETKGMVGEVLQAEQKKTKSRELLRDT